MSYNIPLQIRDWADRFLKARLGSDYSLTYNESFWELKNCGSDDSICILSIKNFYTVGSEIGPAFAFSDVQAHGLGPKSKKTVCWEYNSSGNVCNFDIIGFAYWALNRLEEYNVAPTALDKYGRFKSSHSHAFLNDYLDRPLVDEWIEILRVKCKEVWPEAQLNTFNFDIEISHDVDSVLRYGAISPTLFVKKLFRGFGSENFWRFIYAPISYLTQNIYLSPHDPENNFDWIMDISDRAEIKSTFFFITGQDVLRVDPRYRFNSTAVRRLLKKIISRGHCIGLHPSLNSTFHSGHIKSEWRALQRVTNIIGGNPISARMHYLQWVAGVTPRELRIAGICRDYSLGYADRAGFRASTCYHYELFDPVSLVSYGIEMRPLIIMDRTLTSSSYMNLNEDEILNRVKELSRKCHSVSGRLSILWHNGQLASRQQQELYVRLLKVILDFREVA